MQLVAEEIGIGLSVGLFLTTMAALFLKFTKGQQWLTGTWIQVPVVTLAFGCFAAAQFLGGSGVIAAFSGGLLFGGFAKHHREELLRAAEGTGDTLALITWVIFGSAVVGQAVGRFSGHILLYAVLSLTAMLSILTHGVSASPWAKAYGARRRPADGRARD
jgi:NhaP-type Na+/H+ or K+/H+ antiporter